jgi:hypothetical protein
VIDDQDIDISVDELTQLEIDPDIVEVMRKCIALRGGLRGGGSWSKELSDKWRLMVLTYREVAAGHNGPDIAYRLRLQALAFLGACRDHLNDVRPKWDVEPVLPPPSVEPVLPPPSNEHTFDQEQQGRKVEGHDEFSR